VAGDLEQLLVAQQALARDVDALAVRSRQAATSLSVPSSRGRGAARLQPAPGLLGIGAVGAGIVQHRHSSAIQGSRPLFSSWRAASRRPRADG
jgi:hypothetical protein